MSTTKENFHSEESKGYSSWEELVEAEANGWVVVAILRERARRQLLFPMVLGPFASKREATNARQRLYTKYRRENSEGYADSDLVGVSVRPLWKDKDSV